MEQGENPLQNALILSHIFSKLKKKDKKEFRNVNRVWRNSTLEKWRRKSSVVNLKGDVENRSFTDFIEFCNSEETPRMADLPFRRFRIIGFDELKYGVRGDEDFNTEVQVAFERFLDIFGPLMEYFEIGYCTIYCRSFIHFVKWVLLQKCPHLKELRIGQCQFVFMNPNQFIESDANPAPFVREVAEELTKLCLFTIDCNNDDYDTDEEGEEEVYNVRAATSDFQSLLEVLPNLKDFRHSSWGSQNIFNCSGSASATFRNNPKLEILKLMTCKNAFPLLLNYVKSAQPPLKVFKFKVDELNTTGMQNIRVQPYPFHQILSLCSATLTTLELDLSYEQDDENNRRGPTWITDLTGRSFHQLIHLSLVTPLHKEAKFDFNGLCGMPNLKKFVCTYHNSQDFPFKGCNYLSVDELKYEGDKREWMGCEMLEQDYESLELEHLEEFEFNMPRKFGVDSLRKVGGWIKNLKRLRLILDDNHQMIEEVGKLWPKLEELTILKGSKINKETIQATGFIKDSIKIIEDL